MINEKRLTVMTIAGSDSGGGAGVQADLKTFAAFDCFGTSVITAVTAQNTLGVHAIHAVPPEIVAAQVEALASDLPPDALKTGMLNSREVVEVVIDAVVTHGWRRLVVDPVFVSSSGVPLLVDDGIDLVRDALLPLAAWVTPNLDEAERLTGRRVRTPSEMADAGKALLDLGAGVVYLKGGHLDSDIIVDLLVTPDEIRPYTHARVATKATHGTGCTLSAAITAALAIGAPTAATAASAYEYVQAAMRAAPGLGQGQGPLWHGVQA
ncbi:MAG TPA: bifunctional hydroxymethylpyrimidine kinase/phosphomethylpyrimidine kinase [Gemmatimonadales bacterium]|nr:bifunctional hydroxymethylpyrimidine kinase/phosphomethylpyrimidine kinase [Gemmatimonadales bacterium]